MKMQLKPMLLLIGVSSFIFVGCQKSEGFTAPSSQSSTVQSPDEFSQLSDESAQAFTNAYSEDLTNAISVRLTTTTPTAIGTPPVVLKTGTFVASHDLGDTGLYVMHVKYFDPLLDSIHCITTFYPNRAGTGTFTTSSRCSIVTNIVKWVITYGTGRYANLHGHGTVEMIPGQEMATGKIRYK
jgi:hypothetical protein